MLVYIIMIGLTASSTYVAKHSGHHRWQKMSMLFISVMIPALVAGFRYKNGTDYLLYYSMFNSIRRSGGFNANNGKTIEFGFIWLVKLCCKISQSNVFIYFIIAFFIVFFYVKGCWRLSCNVSLSIILFFIIGTYFDSFNGLRQYIAAAITFFAIPYIFEHNLKKYMVLFLLAMCFHNSAIIMLPVYFVGYYYLDIKKTLIMSIVILFGGSILFSAITHILPYTNYSFYLDSTILGETNITQMAILHTVVMTATATIIYANQREITKRQEIFYSLNSLALCTALMSTFFAPAYRVQYYFLPIEMIFIPELLSMLKSKKNKILVGTMLVSMYLSTLIYGTVFRDLYTCIPYNFYFDFIQK